MRTAVLCGLGSYLPAQVVTNDDLSARLDTSDEWIRTRTGIARRHVVADGETVLHLAVEAGREALKSAGSSDVDAVVVATMTPDRLCPATAPEVAVALGLPQVAAFDVGAICSGFVYGLATAAGLIAAHVAERVLLIGAEAMTGFLDPADRNTAVIFGDGAGAVVLRAGNAEEEGAVGPFDLGSDGDAADLITIDAGGSRVPPRSGRPLGPEHFLAMDGREVYRRAIPAMVASSQAALAARGWTAADVDALVAHQANIRIVEAVADRLGIPPPARVANIAEVGNTSAASIPLALAHGANTGQLYPGAKVLLTAFGAGLTWGSTTLVWPSLATA